MFAGLGLFLFNLAALLVRKRIPICNLLYRRYAIGEAVGPFVTSLGHKRSAGIV